MRKAEEMLLSEKLTLELSALREMMHTFLQNEKKKKEKVIFTKCLNVFKSCSNLPNIS